MGGSRLAGSLLAGGRLGGGWRGGGWPGGGWPGGGWPGGGRLGRGRLRGGSGRLGVGFRLARDGNHQARWNGPGGHEVFRAIPAEQAGTLSLFLSRVPRRGPDITVPTRLVTFCIHHRPQSRHTFLANTAVCRSSHFLVQRDRPAVRCYRLRASVYRGQFSELAGPHHNHARDLIRGRPVVGPSSCD